MTSVHRIGPLPSVLRSINQWVRVGFYLTTYGLPEMIHILAFNMFRQGRKITPNNEFFRRLEQYCLLKSEAHRHRWSHTFCSTFGIDIQIENHLKPTGSNEKRALVVLLNQTSLLEVPIVGILSGSRCGCNQCSYKPSMMPYCFVFQNIEFALIPFIGWNIGLSGVVIRRGVHRSTRQGVQRVLKRMETFQDSFYMSVEGQRSKDGKLSIFKKGPAIIAIQSQTDIIPISIENAGNLWPYGHWRIRPGQVKIIIHDRISTEQMTLDHKDQLTQQLRNIAENQ